MRILVLGAGGMAGHVIALYLREKGFIVDTLSEKNLLDSNTHLVDVTKKEEFEIFLSSRHYDVVVNCIAVLGNDNEERKDLATYLNAYLPHFLEFFFQESKTRIIHLSSDGVFSDKNPPYEEGANYDGLGFYARSKALGEIINNKDLTLRMSIVGPDMKASGGGLLNWFLQQKGEISGYEKVLWTGVSTIELAKGIEAAITQKITGVYHFVPSTTISKFELLHLFKKVFGREDITIRPNSNYAFDRVLVNTRSDFDFTISSYKIMIEDVKSWIESHNHLYQHYRLEG